MSLFNFFNNTSLYDILDKYETNEFSNGDLFECWDASDVAKVIRTDQKRLKQYLELLKEHYGKKGRINEVIYNIHFINKDNFKFNKIGLWILFDYLFVNQNFRFLKQYLDLLKNIAFEELLAHQRLLIFNDPPYKKAIKSSNKNNVFKSNNFSGLYKKNPKYFDNKNNYDKELLVPNFDIDDKDHLFYKKKIVITGEFEKIPEREEMMWLIKNAGGDNNVAVSRKTDFVILGKNPGPKKMQQIKEFNIKTITENEFYDLFDGWLELDEFDNDDLLI